MTKTIVGALLAGAVLFLVSALSWMVLPFHANTMTGFADDKAVNDVIRKNAKTSGVYLSPSDKDRMGNSPIIYAAIRVEGMTSMTKPMIVGFLVDVFSALLVSWLLLQTAGQSFGGRVAFVVVVGLAAGVMTRLPDWNWWGFTPGYTLVAIMELVVGWFLAGLLLAKFAVRQTSVS